MLNVDINALALAILFLPKSNAISKIVVEGADFLYISFSTPFCIDL